MQHTLIIVTLIVRDIITNFADTFTTLLRSSDEEIDSFMKETHRENSARTANVNISDPI